MYNEVTVQARGGRTRLPVIEILAGPLADLFVSVVFFHKELD